MHRVRVGVGVGDDRQAVGKGERAGIAEGLRGEVVEADGAAAQADGADIGQAQASIGDRHVH